MILFLFQKLKPSMAPDGILSKIIGVFNLPFPRPLRERAGVRGMLSETALKVLREYKEQYKPVNWLFEGARSGRYLSTRSAEKVFEHACQKAQIGKDVSIHTLRHYAEFRTMPSTLNRRSSNVLKTRCLMNLQIRFTRHILDVILRRPGA